MPAKILIVDDEPDIIAILKLTLETKGFTVVTAYDGEECLQKVEEEAPDLIMLDILMPKAFGDSVATKIRANPVTAHTPIIFITNLPFQFLSGKQGILENINLDSEGNCYLPKSCSEEDLMRAIRTALPNKNS
ncbi:MAG TPA: response regulator [Candidatus Omnitrophota bacterium]|nr:response regulator [Candidatus Omnitrophota bacterium]HPT08008.1 response regulator [Candidatus Omnitrophota bacterium]